MKAYIKSILKMFKTHIARFFTLLAIVVVSIGFVSGVGEVENKIAFSLTNYYKTQNVSDLIVKSSSQTGFSSSDISYFQEKFGNENVMTGFSFDTKIEDDIVRIYSFDLSKNLNINKLNLVEGSFPTSSNEVLVQVQSDTIKSYELNEKITFQGSEYTVCGVVENPLIIHKVGEPSLIYENEDIDNVIYFNNIFPIVNDLYITISDRELFDNFSDDYQLKINLITQEIQLNFSDAIILSLNENFGIKSLSSYAEKVGQIGIIFIIFFLLVTALVVFSTMTRLLDEERGQIACLKTLGYSDFSIIFRYLLFVFFATILGGILAFGVGVGLTNILYTAFKIQYIMPKVFGRTNYYYYFFTLIIIVLSSLFVTFVTGLSMLKTEPAKLLVSKTPKSGKKVFLEYIPFIWNNLSFKHKSSFRNVFLFKSRFFMTVISVIGSTILMFAGLSLFDNTKVIKNSSSIAGVALVVIVFAGALSALVVYNLTNINVSERKREIATLMVLGYKDKEVEYYIYREVYIMSFIGAILGLPLSYLFVDFIFNFINFGSVSNTCWWSWILAPVSIMFFTFLSTVMLKNKIVKTDMNASLKAVEWLKMR